MSIDETITVETEIVSTPRVDVDVEAELILVDLATALGGLTGAIAALQFLAVGGAAVLNPDAPRQLGGVGYAIANTFPKEWLLPGGEPPEKLVFDYDRFEIGLQRVRAGATPTKVRRVGRVAINGEDRVDVRQGTAMARLRFGATTVDLRSPVRLSWTSTGAVSNPGAPFTIVTVPLRGARAGDQIRAWVSVAASDPDGVQGNDRAEVTINVTARVDAPPNPRIPRDI